MAKFLVPHTNTVVWFETGNHDSDVPGVHILAEDEATGEKFILGTIGVYGINLYQDVADGLGLAVDEEGCLRVSYGHF